MDYGEVLRSTWQITWRNKGLWVLGILAALSSSGGGGSGRFSGFQYQTDGGEFPGVERFVEDFEGAIIAAAIGLACVALLAVVTFFVLGIIGQGGLIASFGRADEGKAVSLSEGFRMGVANFWKIFGIRIVVWLAGLAAVIVTAMFVIGTLGLALLCLIPLICLLIPVFIFLDGYITLTMVAAVEEDLSVIDAFGRAWRLIRENVVPVLIMAVILIIGGGIVSSILALPFITVAFPAIVGAIGGTEAAVVTGIVFTCLLLLVAIPIGMLVFGIFNTFITGAWTLTYRRLTGKMGVEGVAVAA